jgi:hypothetical protein
MKYLWPEAISKAMGIAPLTPFLQDTIWLASSADSCVCHSDGHVKIVTGIFVDDGISCSIDESKLTDMLQYLRKHFEVRKELATTALVLMCSAVATPAVFSSTSNDT